jgi:hypothetical protein
MGIDRFSNFISKITNNEATEEINIDSNIKKILSNHILFDINFIIYQELINIENEINDIIKIILCLPYTLDKDKINNLLDKILKIEHWEYKKIIFDGITEEDIIYNFLNQLDTLYNNTSILELIIYEKILNTIINYIKKFSYQNMIESICIFFDGIPSLSKIIEQRKRRIRNYLESNEKKTQFNKYFTILESQNRKLNEHITIIKDVDDNIYFDYLKWIKIKYTLDKSIAPSSLFINNLEKFLKDRLRNIYPNFTIHIDNSSNNGEADVKIFKYISETNISGDIIIHTIDSDLIHQILVQQVYYKIINREINLIILKYLKNMNNGYVQIIIANNLIKNIIELYNNTNNINTNNYKIIWDLCLLFLLFGNDHLPNILEIGPELGIEYFLKIHWKALNNNNIISIKKKKILMDTNNLLLILNELNIDKEKNITKIILYRYFKINHSFINLITEDLELNFNKLLELLNDYYIYNIFHLSKEEFDNIDEDDIRKKYNYDEIKNNYTIDTIKDIFKLSENKTEILFKSLNIIQECLDYYEYEYNGLIIYNKLLNITENKYDDIYNIIIDKSINKLNKSNPIYYDYIDLETYLKYIDNKNKNEYEYLKKLYHICITQFGNMSNYISNNITYYSYINAPSIEDLIKFINNNNDIILKWNNDIKDENIDNYINIENHYLLISPYVENSQIILDDKFDYKKINIKKYIL